MTTEAPPDLRRSERAVLKVLEKHGGQSMSVADLARAAGYSEPAVTTARRRLRALGLISFTPGTGHTAVRYAISSPSPAGAAATLGGFHIGRTLSSGVLHLLDSGGEMPPVPCEFRADTVCRPVPETAPLMELARGPVSWELLCRACLKAIGAAPGAGSAGQKSSVEISWQVQVWHNATRAWRSVGRPSTSEAAVRAELAVRRARYPELLFRPVVRTITETVLH
ncbi:helix-turn-helix transcriptional regulator [Streptomyces lavenduligriseus]|uniref:MarR family transcriptional regulator n=1 Tax=Streptomyces lavenduligriseus TaxID=67315 RepID=A0ABT0P7J4_9ACTN|nr:helix-turn-helix domain-containing protein [Streptomyces lavenduligriseus]MCL3998977.1 MarR family transcriptional regulator [Streptomyces lavenduligriseus]